MADKVLIVDDDIQTLRLVSLMLERQGYKILAANSGSQALHMAHTDAPDVIVLDVMMPDIDGYEVTRRLRKDPETADIPILMFTAKTQVDDKITGYDAGADDYLTKPIHPAELTAHLHTLLQRRRGKNAPSKEHAYTIGVMAAKGGMGVSTLALNLAIAFYQKTKTEAIAAELRPGQGTWGVELGNTSADGLGNLLRMRPQDISAVAIENELVRMPYGVRLLLASSKALDAGLVCAAEQFSAVIENIGLLSKLVILDIGALMIPCLDALSECCNEMLVVTEPFPSSVQRTRRLLDDLSTKGFGRTKLVTVVSVQRARVDFQLTNMQMQEILGVPVAQNISPAPEIAFQAANRNMPLIQVQIGGAISQQIGSLAERFAQRMPL